MNKPENIDAFMYYVHERESIRQKKELNSPLPWTTDPILSKYKFTNIKRQYDKTTRHFKKIYDQHSDPYEIFLNAVIHRFFGTIEFADAIGWQRTWQPEAIKDIARTRLNAKQRVFTGAYVIANNGLRLPKEEVVVDIFLSPYEKIIPELIEISKTQRWELVTKRIIDSYGFRGFMAKEVVQDVMLTPILSGATDRNSWTTFGPGGRRGLNRIYGRKYDENAKSSLGSDKVVEEMKWIMDYYNDNHECYMPIFDLHDVQWNCCEIDKYLRVKNGEGKPRSLYKAAEVKKGFF